MVQREEDFLKLVPFVGLQQNAGSGLFPGRGLSAANELEEPLAFVVGQFNRVGFWHGRAADWGVGIESPIRCNASL